MKLLQKEPPIFFLDKEDSFPNLLDDLPFDDLIAIGADLDPKRLIKAYKSGYFPWFIEQGFPYWFSPNPRMIIDKNSFKISKSLRKVIKSGKFQVKENRNFKKVIQNCAKVKRSHEEGTWISDEFITSYTKLHQLGVAISVESYYENQLVGGFYGLMIDNLFFGESMFSLISDSSKVAFATFAQQLFLQDSTTFIDCQTPSPYLKSFGGFEIERITYLKRLFAKIS